jgi:hypothetical protein
MGFTAPETRNRKCQYFELVPKLIDYALTRMVFGQALAVFQAFSLAKLRNLGLLSPKLKFWESLFYGIVPKPGWF